MTPDDNPRVFVPPPLIFGGLLGLGLLIDSKPMALRPIPVIGIALGVAGMALIAMALGLFRTSGTRPEPWQPASALVNRGIYRYTRNPMYLGMAMLCVGVAMAFTSWPAVLMSLVAAIIVDRFVVKREEAYLARRFGEDYTSYTRTVRRWL